MTEKYSRRTTLKSLIPATAAAGLSVEAAMAAPQPMMHAAMEHLRAAKESLERAMNDKGGHRQKAIRLVDEAIGQVAKGMEAANR